MKINLKNIKNINHYSKKNQIKKLNKYGFIVQIFNISTHRRLWQLIFFAKHSTWWLSSLNKRHYHIKKCILNDFIKKRKTK
jgi:hypothetical protein